MPNRRFGPGGPSTPEQISGAISAMRDSVWAINDAMEKALSEETPSEETLEVIGRNVAHLELMMGKEEITEFGEDLSDVTGAITAGKAFQEEHQELLDEE
jgi:hypothetical protein